MTWPDPLFGLPRRRRLDWVALLFAFGYPVAMALLTGRADEEFGAEVASGSAWQSMLFPTAMVYAMVGSMLTHSHGDLLRSGLQWNLPGLRAWRLKESLVSGGVVVLLIAVSLYVLRPPGETGLQFVAGTVFCLACFFAAGTGVDPATPTPLRIVLWLLIYVLILGSKVAAPVVVANPIAVILLGSLAIVAMLAHQSSRGAALKRPRAVEAVTSPEEVEIWPQYWGTQTEWARPLTPNRLIPWLFAGVYETGWGTLHRPLGFMSFFGLALAFVIHYITTGYLALVTIGMLVWAFAAFPSRLRAGLAYPLSRRERARLVATGAMVQEAGLLLLTLAFLALIKLTPLADLWHLRLPGEVIDWPVTVLVAFAWMPIVSWGSVYGAAAAGRVVHNLPVVGLLPLAAYLLAVAWTMGPTGDRWRSDEWPLVVALVALITLGTRVALWWATHRLFARADLSPAGVG